MIWLNSIESPPALNGWGYSYTDVRPNSLRSVETPAPFFITHYIYI